MLKNYLILALFFFGNFVCVAQKIIEKEFFAENIHTLSIVDDAIYKISIFTSEVKSIKVSLRISGENSQNIALEEIISEEKLLLKTGLIPFAVLENDKLAAHKVIALEMELVIPKTIYVEIKSKLASLETKGSFKSLAVSLQDGNCVLDDFSGNAQLRTAGGYITVFADNTVSGKASSKYGLVKNELFSDGEFLIEAESINGIIKLLQTK